MSCIRQVFPSASITPNCVNKYPIRVKIEAHDDVDSSNNTTKLWEGDQKSLFGKYASRRSAAMEEMVNQLNAYKSSRL